MKQIVETISCDFCNKVISECIYLEKLKKDCCKDCLKGLFKDIEAHYMKHVHGQVRDRRGGWRTLGDFADT